MRQFPSLSVDDLDLMPRLPWWRSIAGHWTPGEDAALSALDAFVGDAMAGYAIDRDRPDRSGTSRLSPHLHFGELGPRQVWHAAMAAPDGTDRERFLSELGWREFAQHLLIRFPRSADHDFNDALSDYPWRNDAAAMDDFQAWTEGRTGVELVDAGMRELWRSGWMHNRVRMVAASYLTKNLRIHWRLGARWFWDTLVDADLASNTLGWQWVAGCGVDAAPYFRIFNPDTQAQRFDPERHYRQHWLKGHSRPEAPPLPLKASRAAALEAYKSGRVPRTA